MKRRTTNNTILFLAYFVSLLIFCGCNDWTNAESVDINQPGIENQNPELYSQYLSNLKLYKASVHKITIGWFDNSNKLPINHAQHIIAAPDSLDLISLIYPDSLSQGELGEMTSLRESKGTKIIFTLNFDAIKLIYDTRVNDLKNSNNTNSILPDFNSFLVDSVKHALSLVKEYNYDGISIAYNGKPKLYMTDAEKITYSGYENAFLGIATDWHSRNIDKMILFQGKPQNIIDQTIFKDYSYIIIPSMDVVSEAGMTYNISSACSEGIPTDRFIPMVQTTSLDQSDVKTGYWSNGSYAITGASVWAAAEHIGFTVKGLGFYNVNNDYYNPAFTYNHVRNAIVTINPSLKK
jgi:hypothetical protein